MWKWASTNGAQQLALCVHHLGCRSLSRRETLRDLDDATVLYGHAHLGAAIGQGGVVDQEV
jgi:hypothetical protein